MNPIVTSLRHHLLVIYSTDNAFSNMSLLDELKSQDKNTALAAFKRLKFYWNLGMIIAFPVIFLTFTFSIISPQRLIECISENQFQGGRVTCR